MRTIERGPASECLAEQPSDQDWRGFIGTPCHADVHDDLSREQHGLCCYCEIDIWTDDGHIEHMEPRSKNQKRIYDYTNLALSCNGGSNQHCGHYKDNGARKVGYSWDSKFFVPPHNPLTATLFQYLVDGSIVPTKEDPDKSSYLIGYLGLDCPRLRTRRHQHARAVIKTLGGQCDGSLLDWLKENYLCCNEEGQLKEFYSLSKQILEP